MSNDDTEGGFCFLHDIPLSVRFFPSLQIGQIDYESAAASTI
jgi:hypothetical protein